LFDRRAKFYSQASAAVGELAMLTTPIASIAFVAGLALIALGVFGGGFETKIMRIPPLPTILRAACFIFGCILSGLVLFKPSWFEQPKQPATEQQQTTTITNPKQSNAPAPTEPTISSPTTSPTIAQAPEPKPPSPNPPPPNPPPPNPPPPKTYSQVLPILFVANQENFAQKLRNYLATKGYTISTRNTNFSEIKGDNRQKAGTIRIIYKSTAKDFEPILADAIRAQFPTMRLVESLNDGARVDLQIQLW
jgi:hypothetical protein